VPMGGEQFADGLASACGPVGGGRVTGLVWLLVFPRLPWSP
jgi:hypothetical protein